MQGVGQWVELSAVSVGRALAKEGTTAQHAVSQCPQLLVTVALQQHRVMHDLWAHIFWLYASYKLSTSLFPSPAAFFERGQVHSAKQRWQQALQDYSRAISIQPDYIAGTFRGQARGLMAVFSVLLESSGPNPPLDIQMLPITRCHACCHVAFMPAQRDAMPSQLTCFAPCVQLCVQGLGSMCS
jgi:hypothetical protein